MVLYTLAIVLPGKIIRFLRCNILALKGSSAIECSLSLTRRLSVAVQRTLSWSFNALGFAKCGGALWANLGHTLL